MHLLLLYFRKKCVSHKHLYTILSIPNVSIKQIISGHEHVSSVTCLTVFLNLHIFFRIYTTCYKVFFVVKHWKIWNLMTLCLKYPGRKIISKFSNTLGCVYTMFNILLNQLWHVCWWNVECIFKGIVFFTYLYKSLQFVIFLHISDPNFNTLISGLIQAVHKKQLDRTWLCAGISPLLYGLRTWLKYQKTWQVL